MQTIDSTFTVPPFPAFPSVSRYVPLGSLQESLERVCRSIDAHEGVSLVIGPPGTGKSLMCGLLVEHYRQSHEVVILGETPIEDAAAFQRHLLHHLGADFESIPNGDLQLALIDRVCDAQSPSGGLLIVVDEAQSLSPEVIESIRMTTNIMRDGEPRVCVVLCGGVKLEESLVSSSMEAFTQRVATRCYLHAMNGDETRMYVNETIRNCGAEPENTITSEAIAAVHHACMGVPRLVNQIMTEAIDCAADADQELIDEKLIDKAWSQLQQLPSPMVEEPKFKHEAAPIEFGELGELGEFGDSDSLATASDLEPDSMPEELEQVQTLGNNESIDFSEADEVGSQCSLFNGQPDIEIDSGVSAEWEIEPQAPDEIAPEKQSPIASESPIALAERPVAPPLDAEPLDQACEDSHPCEPVVSPGALFGDFDDEEEVAIGNGVKILSHDACGAPAADLESILHQEIVGISSVAHSGMSPLSEQNEHPSTCDDLDATPAEMDQNAADESMEIEADTESAGPSSPTADSVIWFTEGQEQSVVQDDSDLLVIEDEIELTINHVKTVDAEAQTISVDFQAMLARMRSGA